MKEISVKCNKCEEITTIRVDENCIELECIEEREMGPEETYSVNVERKCSNCKCNWNSIKIFDYAGVKTAIGFC